MRVVGGKYRSRKLLEFKGSEIRPTSDFAKESLFNILGDVTDKSMLDLFCGSGNVGIEMISRGGKTTFIDNRKESVALTKSNLEKLGESALVIIADAISYLKSCDKKYDIIFLDPPYNSGLGEKCLKIIAEKKLLSENGVAVFEDEKQGEQIENLNVTDKRKYGRAFLTFYRY